MALHPRLRSVSKGAWIRGRPRRASLAAVMFTLTAGIAYWLPGAMVDAGFGEHALEVATGVLCPTFALTAFAALVSLVGSFGRPCGLVLTADQRTQVSTRRIDGDVLARNLDALDALAAPGERCFSRYVDLDFRKGMARHDPQALIDVIAVLRTRLASDIDPGLEPALEALTVALGEVKDQGRTCCLMATGVGSGAIETNLGLYFVAS